MFVTMTCSCGADLELDVQDNDTLVLVWAQRFTDSHAACGYMAPPATDPPETIRKVVEQPKKSAE